jgi:hypothetical protein
MSKLAGLGAALVVFLAVAAPAAAGLTQDRRLGNDTEDITTITNGQNEGQVAALDGYDVIAVPAAGKSKQPPHTLFSLKSVPWGAFPSGLAYVGPDHTYVFSDQGAPDQLTFTDASGQLLSETPVTYLPTSPLVFGVEALVYLDKDAAFPDTIARAILGEDGAYIEILDRSGVVQRDIPVAVPYITGLTYVPPGRFLVSTADQNIWTVGLDGSIVSGPVAVPEAADVEGLTLADGQVVAADYTAGSLFIFDKKLRRTSDRDRSFPIGVGISRTFDAVWDPISGGWAVQGLDRDHQQSIVATVPTSLASKTALFHLPTFTQGLTELPDGSFSLCNVEQPSIDHYSRAGVLLGSINLPAAGLTRVCNTLAYLPSLNAYALRERRQSLARIVYLVSSGGSLMGSFTAPELFANLAKAPDGPGDEVLLWEPFSSRVETYREPAGTLVAQRTIDTGPIAAPFSFAAGPAGSYAILDGNDSEVATFSP